MRISKIHIDGFGKLHDLDLAPGPGITIFTGSNEAGKTTLHLFLRSVLYGASTKHRAGMKSVYERMRPWRQPEVYRGRIEVEYEQESYVIERDFNKAPNDLKIYKTGPAGAVPAEDPAALLKQILGGLSETAYVNTVSSGQLGAATQRDMASELCRYASNISGTMNPGLSAGGALEYLEQKKAGLEAEVADGALKEYNSVLSAVKKLEAELELPENDNKIRLYDEAAKKTAAESESLNGSIAGVRASAEGLREELQSRGFADGADINRIADEINLGYGRLKEAEKKAFSGSVTAMIIMLAALAAAAAGAAFSGAVALPVPREYFAAFALIPAAAAAALTVRQARRRRAWRKDRTELAGKMTPYIGECTADEAGIRAFNNYVESARKVSDDYDYAKRRERELCDEQARLGSERELYLENLRRQEHTMAEVETKLTRLEALKRRASALQKTVARNSELQDEIEAVEMAEDTIRELEHEIRNAAGTYINKEASEMVAAITDGAYDSICAGPDYDIRLNSPDGMIPVSSTSAGTADQVYLAVRLAAVRFIAGEDDPLPLVLDDSFNLYDDSRLRASLRFLTQNYRGQILLFTCVSREEKMLEELGTAFTSIRL